MIERDFPILEFDDDSGALIRPDNLFVKQKDAPERCVLCFFDDAIEKIISENPYRIIAAISAGTIKVPVYELFYKNERIALVRAGFGAPVAGRQIDELSALGFGKFIACGSCGVLRSDIVLGHLIIPMSAVRDEGTSYHYIKPSREIAANGRAIRAIESALIEQEIPYIKAKTWTSDACYRETEAKIRLRKSEGCAIVEMEAAAYMAASQFLGVEFGQILYAGDDLGGEKWDSRGFNKRSDIREFVLRTALDACLKM